MATLMNFRVDDDLRERFTEAAETKHQTPSEAMRDALLLYIKRVRNEQLREASERIRTLGKEDEEDAMRWIEAHSVVLSDDD
ncbi:ribbon-helix-helix protein, CopG family [Sinorhizobium sp. BG8]|uniref:ribbon-helix-helix protein, CopG family n=1 Tax=Sinorhizobium sp. BG8 TaxID=2613773 RepID=UPI00193D9B80|nr:ribbon-helix-helix protein, CopG family [Sinorhizobium sp. BG8]QRM54715.1 ribbon-helix-helix protein, CopG family [Sinorhizobium sp. BG8]